MNFISRYNEFNIKISNQLCAKQSNFLLFNIYSYFNIFTSDIHNHQSSTDVT